MVSVAPAASTNIAAAIEEFGPGAEYSVLLGWLVLGRIGLNGPATGRTLIPETNLDMKHSQRLTLPLALACSLIAPVLRAADAPALFPDPSRPVSELTREAARNAAGLRAWKWSLAPVIATQALDAASSWNMRELNPALANGDGRFAGKAAALKFGAAGALLCAEFVLVKRHPGAARVLAKLN